MSEGHLDHFILSTDSHKGMFNSMGMTGCATKMDGYIHVYRPQTVGLWVFYSVRLNYNQNNKVTASTIQMLNENQIELDSGWSAENTGVLHTI